ncbi:Glucan endo-1,3-beta-glucosidase [Quillaja saponaria]|uniref:Glucan endo-1,3-beta-glucosidase n=1 Tax=Quillaja saponaria TaxID=32244 RepID=A0AAD7PUQ3_QUISA|nr:Glucan endo-1,3-beta-glucosidase [Quillaja saponaria]
MPAKKPSVTQYKREVPVFPQTRMNHASFAMNAFYQTHVKTNLTCFFKNSGQVMEAAHMRVVFLLQLTDGKVDCEDIKEGGQCFNPNSTINYVMVVMNIFYSQIGFSKDCDFKNSGMVVLRDPSKSNFHYLLSV